MAIKSLRYYSWVKWGFPGGSVVKNLSANAGRHRGCRFAPQVRKIPWRRKWQPTSVFLPGKSQQRNLEGYNPWCCKELDTRECEHTCIHTDTSLFKLKYVLKDRIKSPFIKMFSMNRISSKAISTQKSGIAGFTFSFLVDRI